MCYRDNLNSLQFKSQPFVVFKDKVSESVTVFSFINNYFTKSTTSSKELLFVDPQSHSLSILNGFSFGRFKKLGESYLNSIVRPSRIFFYKRVSYTGKGYRIYIKNKSKLYFQLGYSHKYYLFSYDVTLKPILKSKLLLLSSSLINLSNFSKMIFKLRPLNIFTLKGIRFTKQVVYKKIGKVSSYR